MSVFSTSVLYVWCELPLMSLAGVGWLKAGVSNKAGGICSQAKEKSAYHLEKNLLTIWRKFCLPYWVKSAYHADKKVLTEIMKSA
ncbi:MAG: hypothetical protein GX325_04305 [Peptococcaceae bacterium]|nr:hypothetical protein [Peptococcaceae bacterium]